MASAYVNPSGNPILPAPTKELYIETFSEFFESLKNDFEELKDNQSYLNVFDGQNISGYPSKNKIILMHLFLDRLNTKCCTGFDYDYYPVNRMTDAYNRMVKILDPVECTTPEAPEKPEIEENPDSPEEEENWDDPNHPDYVMPNQRLSVFAMNYHMTYYPTSDYLIGFLSFYMSVDSM